MEPLPLLGVLATLVPLALLGVLATLVPLALLDVLAALVTRQLQHHGATPQRPMTTWAELTTVESFSQSETHSVEGGGFSKTLKKTEEVSDWSSPSLPAALKAVEVSVSDASGGSGYPACDRKD